MHEETNMMVYPATARTRQLGRVAPGRDVSLVGVTSIAPLLWGMTYVVTTELLPPGRPLLAATVRALSAGVILAVISPRRPRGDWWVKAAVLGVLNIGAFFALLFVAAYRLPGGVAATLGSIQPLIAAGLAVHLLRERLRVTVVLAGLLGVAGVALVVLRPDAALDAVGIVAGLAGAASMATGTVLAKRWGQPVPVVAFTAWQLIAGGLALLVFVPIAEGVPTELTQRNLAGFGWFAVSTAAAYLVWFRGIAALAVARVSMLGLLSPIVATVAGWMLLDQPLTVVQLLGAALVLIAITLGQRRGGAQRSRTSDVTSMLTSSAMFRTSSSSTTSDMTSDMASDMTTSSR
jgi:probable blue pigment (indigoidine) exporter